MQIREFRFSPKAVSEIDSIVVFFDEESEYKGDKFYTELIQDIKYICQLPQSRRKVYKNFRLVYMRHFSFVIIYSLVKRVIYVHSVKSTHEDISRVFSDLSSRQ